MTVSDLWLAFSWWAVLFLFGAVAFPLTRRVFGEWWDEGYGLTKAFGVVLVTYVVWVAASIRILPYTHSTIVISLVGVFLVGIAVQLAHKPSKKQARFPIVQVVGLEFLFGGALICWAYIKAHEPSIHSLEKFMDYGFTQSILNTRYFPAADMWFAGESINYYTFGHTMMATLTRFSGIHLSYAFNLMLATLFALTFSMSFSVGIQGVRILFASHTKEQDVPSVIRGRFWQFAGGVLAAFVITFGGNLQTIYAFTRGYNGENTPPPFWEIMYPVSQFREMITHIQDYWYANATRFIPFTIHEFPSYSFVVSDVHGHVLSIPIVILAFALLLTMFAHPRKVKRQVWEYVLLSFLISAAFMTNALDGPVYLGIFCFFIFLQCIRDVRDKKVLMKHGLRVVGVIGGFVLFSLPFLAYFDSFAKGIAINCPIPPLTNMKFGPVIFESVDKCQRTPLWMFFVIWGFFLYMGAVLILASTRIKNRFVAWEKRSDRFYVVVFLYCVMLILFAEVFYFKDIYPAHFRSNTMFKFGYQAFIMFGFISSYTAIRVLSTLSKRFLRTIFLVTFVPQLVLVLMFSYLAVNTYFGGLQTYKGIYGMEWMDRQYADDSRAIQWLRDEIQSSERDELPVIVEAEGESYTDFARFSAFVGVPSIVGWPVHEWLWHGTYDVVGPRVEDVKLVYTSNDAGVVRGILEAYGVHFVILGMLEHQKYPNIDERIFEEIGTVVFASGETKIYEVTYSNGE